MNIVKHLQAFPEDGILKAVQNVFLFDTYDEQAKKFILQVFNKQKLDMKEIFAPSPKQTEKPRSEFT